jgi:ABC-type transport system involved in cytochrome c biogenesis permease subunit
LIAIPLLFYAAAAVAYTVYFVRRDDRAGRLATAALSAAALAHTFLIGMQTVRVGHAPFGGTTGAISAFVWLLALAYLYLEMSTNERAMGVFILPLLVVLQAIVSVGPRSTTLPEALQSAWFALHVSSLLFAYASFALAAVVGLTYVLLFREIKGKQPGFFTARLPSLRVLDVMNGRAVAVGGVFLTIGVLVGGLWVFQVQSQGASDPRLREMTVLDPKIFVALVCWVVYSFALYARRVVGWSARRAAWLSALGFMIVLLNFVPVGYFLTKSHNF